MKAVAVAVVLAAMAAAKRGLKVAQDVHATVLHLHGVAALPKAHALIAKIVAKDDLMAHLRTVSMSVAIDAMIAPMMDPTTATWTETMTAARVVMSCHVTSTRS